MKIGRYTVIDHSRRAQETAQVSPVNEKYIPKRKALLIGIIYGSAAGTTVLKGPHADVAVMKKLLLDRYDYAESDIVMLLDSEDKDGSTVPVVQPTRVNILRAIDNLVRGARKGDRFFFHYCGHTTQVENRSNSEEDGMDECLVPVDGETNKIVDNELRRHLVNPLPAGSSLVAVFDSCHSASLLDLAHSRCNRVYVPWISKDRRRSVERGNAIVSRHRPSSIKAQVDPLVAANTPSLSTISDLIAKELMERLKMPQNFFTYAFSLPHQLSQGQLDEIQDLVHQWGRWDIFESLANYHSAVKSLFVILNDTLMRESPGTSHVIANETAESLTRDVHALHDTLVSILRSNSDHTNFLACRGKLAQQLLDLVQDFLQNAPPDTDRVSLMLDVAMGLEYLHEKRIVHGDLKGANILVTPSHRACVADFGLASIADTMSGGRFTHSSPTKGGTSRYQAPELLSTNIPNHFGSDVYAFGCVCYEILTGKAPFHEITRDVTVMIKVLEGLRPSRPKTITINEDLWSLIQDCWKEESRDRPSMSQIVQRFIGPAIGAKVVESATDWDETFSSRSRRSLREWPLLPSVTVIERRIFGQDIGGVSPRCFPERLPESSPSCLTERPQEPVIGECMRLAVAVPREKEWFVSWPEEGDERACSSPAPVRPCTGWKCRDVTHGHDDELKADIIALASCKDSELSWEDPSGKSMTQELVRILERDRHPTLRSLITRLSHALHSMSLERHFQARRYKRGLENYNVFLERQRANAALHRPRGAATEDTASHISTLLPSIPDATVPVSRQSLFFSDPKDRDGTAVAMQKPRPLPAARFRSAGFVDERTFDVENFQDPQISSHYPLNMEQPWCL